MRKLSLRKESLTELTTDELGVVVGGTNSKVVCLTDVCPTNPCVTTWQTMLCAATQATREICA